VLPVVELKLEFELEDEADVVPETTGLAVIASVVAMFVSVTP
jgi:hypothetical protein